MLKKKRISKSSASKNLNLSFGLKGNFDSMCIYNSYSRKYAYDGQEILAEFDENDAALAVYTHSTLRTDDVLAADIRSNKLANQTGSYFYLKDAIGSVVDVTDANGNLIQHYAYSSFGKVLKIVDSSETD
ncbi:MAG: hypothetical protein KC478_15725, partial [Bacteriovoracaceae bacterium]|nr:hypothetical protein [Bacteriovoracaceae bacterium]